MNLEQMLPGVQMYGLNTDKNADLGGNVAVGGDLSVTDDTSLAGVVELSLTDKRVAGFGTTTTDLDAQSGTATIAQLLGGVYTHNSKTGAGTITTPTGAEISAGIANVAVGYTFDVMYRNRGNQTVTITAGASGVTILGTAAVPTLKNALLRFVCTAADTWLVYVVLSA